jgi:hypothetical protein
MSKRPARPTADAAPRLAIARHDTQKCSAGRIGGCRRCEECHRLNADRDQDTTAGNAAPGSVSRDVGTPIRQKDRCRCLTSPLQVVGEGADGVYSRGKWLSHEPVELMSWIHCLLKRQQISMRHLRIRGLRDRCS